jgi:membrane protease YdiL (CAAX protease family)
VKHATLAPSSKQGACQPLDVETAPSDSSREASVLAPLGHTAALIAVMLAVALIGTLLQHAGAQVLSSAPPASSNARIWSQYLPLLAANGLLVLYVARLFRPRNFLPELVGPCWRGPVTALVDLLCASLAMALIVAIEMSTGPLLAGRNAAVSALLPSTEAERLTWFLVASSVGFGEEVVFRGYLQTQLGAFTQSPLLGVLLQAVLFALAHLEQGAGAASRIGVYGLILGVLVRYRGRLLPAILCHIGIDLASGLLR